MATPTADPRDFFDFDAWTAEHEQAPIRFRLFGRDWDLPGDVPAATMLKMQKLEVIAETGAVPDGVNLADLSIEALVGEFVGEPVLTEWLALGLRHRTLQAIAGRLYRLHMGGTPATDDPDGETDDDPAAPDPADVDTEPLPEAGEPGKAG